jgi:hypothetical protein
MNSLNQLQTQKNQFIANKVTELYNLVTSLNYTLNNELYDTGALSELDNIDDDIINNGVTIIDNNRFLILPFNTFYSIINLCDFIWTFRRETEFFNDDYLNDFTNTICSSIKSMFDELLNHKGSGHRTFSILSCRYPRYDDKNFQPLTIKL